MPTLQQIASALREARLHHDDMTLAVEVDADAGCFRITTHAGGYRVLAMATEANLIATLGSVVVQP